jgi:heme O synthase-like polyprenyltransferase
MPPSKPRAWLQLLRAPNLLTVPGDPIAGYLLATAAHFPPEVLAAIGASLSLYSSGLLVNDLVDIEEDRRERPERPLPAGVVDPRAARLAAAALGIGGIALAFIAGPLAGGFAIAALASALVYNFWTKTIPVLGAWNMGACRGLSLMIGAASGEELRPRVWCAALILTMYVAAVTHLARHETRTTAPAPAKWLPLLTLFAAPAFLASPALLVNVSLFLCFFAFAVLQAAITTLAISRGAPLPPAIGAFIRVLLPLQAAFCAASNNGWFAGAPALLLLALWPVSRLLGRRFYAS